MTVCSDLAGVLNDVIRADRGRLVAALTAELGDFALAEDVLSDAAESALIHWARSEIPGNPRGWLLKVARRKAIDRFRRSRNFQLKAAEIARLSEADSLDDPHDIPDSRLRLIFACCHPALEQKTRVALTLRTLGGLSTGEVAAAFLDNETTMGQRLSRARKKIARAGIPFAVPEPDLWSERLSAVLSVIYLIFNEGYSALDRSDRTTRTDLCAEAIFLARLMDQLQPDEPETEGLLALMLLTRSRAGARLDENRVLVPLEEQDVKLWDATMADEGLMLIERALRRGRPDPFQIKASIGALHIEGRRAGTTDRRQIVLLYDTLMLLEPSPVVGLNRAVAVSFLGDTTKALSSLDAMAEELDAYQPYHAARAEIMFRRNETDAALSAYERAITLSRNAPDRLFLERRRQRLTDGCEKKGRALSSAEVQQGGRK